MKLLLWSSVILKHWLFSLVPNLICWGIPFVVWTVLCLPLSFRFWLQFQVLSFQSSKSMTIFFNIMNESVLLIILMLFLYKMLFPILLLLQNQSKIETNKIKKMKKKNHDKFSVEIKKFVEEKQLSQLINFNMFHSLLTDAEKNHLLPFLNEETDRVNLSSVQELFSSNAFREALRTFSDEILYQGMDPLHHPALLSSATSSSHHDVNMNININMNMDKEIMDEEDENDDDDDDDFSPGKKSKPKKKVVKKPLSDLPVKNGYGRSQGNVFELKPSLPLWKQSWFSFYLAYRP